MLLSCYYTDTCYSQDISQENHYNSTRFLAVSFHNGALSSRIATSSLLMALAPRGVLERWVRGCAAQIGHLFGLSGLPMAPFLFENCLDIGRVFAKCLIFDEFFLWFTYRLSKSTYASQFTW